MRTKTKVSKKNKAFKKLKKKKIITSSKADKRYGIIDLGTNSVRFDVYTVIKKKIIRFHREKRMIRLGDGVYETGNISKAAIARGVEALKDFKNLADELNVLNIKTFATSALRSAANAETFIEKVQKEAGIDIDIISGKQECEYIAKGIFTNLKVPDEYIALVDIGGGSTEITLSKGSKPIRHISLELGANRLQQLFVKNLDMRGNKDSRSADLDLRQYIREEMEVLFRDVRANPFQFVIGSSGTIRSLVRILNKLGHPSQPSRRQDLAGLVAELRTMSREEIAAMPGVEKGRVDLLLAGALLFDEILYFLGTKNFYATSLCLRDGILQHLIETGELK